MAVWDFLYNFAPDMIDRATIDKIMECRQVIEEETKRGFRVKLII
jgi:hypothetical protein